LGHPVVYFDRCVGTAIPEALRLLGMSNVYHHHIHRAKVGLKPERDEKTLFGHDTHDDVWMDFVASRGWIVISQDYRLHLESAALTSIKQHGAKVFYLWGAEAPKIDVMRVLLNNYKRIVQFAASNPGPYVLRVKARGALQRFM